ncbi:MAG: hypothetical protein JO301_01380 [Chitinophagaceae bacterium]|nr:hypothetical protein [Chitinophagaceae bacterium]
MYRNLIIRNVIIIGALFLITYALAVGINQYNALSIFLALGAFGALCVGIYLFTQLSQGRDEEEQENSY